MRYLDSNFFIYPILYPDDSKSKSIAKALLDIAEGATAATSSLTWDEFTWVVRKKLGIEASKREGRKFLELPNLWLLKVDEALLGLAQDVVERYGLEPRDAIHAASCIANGIGEIVSDDPDFDEVKGIKRVPIERAAKF